MYNELQKNRFLETLTHSSAIKAKAAFKRTESFETMIGIDCAQFTVQEIVACFKQLNSSSINTLRNLKSILSVYADWSKMQNLLPDGINHYREAGQPNLLECMSAQKVDESYLSQPEVDRIVANLENTFEKVAVLLAYEGFLFSNYYDAYMISSADIDGTRLKVGALEGEASDKLRLYIEEAEEAEFYYQRMTSGEVREVKFKDGGGPVFKQLYNAVRTYDTMDQRRHYFERLFRRIRDYTGERFITIKKLNDSGRINAILNFMKEEGATDPRAVFMAHKAELDLKYGEITEVGRLFAVHADSFMTE